MITTKQLTRLGRLALMLNAKYSTNSKGELAIDRILFGLLNGGAYGRWNRQHQIAIGEIDFVQQGSNPVVIEMAYGTLSKLYGSQNAPEIRKLARCTEYSMRYLLLLHDDERPTTLDTLNPTYEPINAGPGRFQRKSVRVIYVHAASGFSFICKPHAE